MASAYSVLRVGAGGAVLQVGEGERGCVALEAGAAVEVDWERSTPRLLWARASGGQRGWLASSGVSAEAALFPASVPGVLCAGAADDEEIVVVDASSSSSASASASESAEALGLVPTLAPGLDSFAWPLGRAEFVATVWRRRAFAVLAAGSRLSGLRRTLHDLDVFRLLDTATSIVAWMRALGGEMQHVAVDATTAKQCYLAGHSLNFNLPPPVQKAFVKPLCADLGVDFAVEREGSVGGDVEMFACRGRQVTGWHYDGQDNFTVQLRGSKRWSVCRGPEFPAGNVNVAPMGAASYAKYLEQKKVQRALSASPVPPPVHAAATRTVVLRPGSVLYFPAGCWHYVEAEDDGGSLSINVSLYPASWLDVVVRSALVQHLLRYRHWREYITVRSPADARSHLAELLRGLPREVAELCPEDVLPDGLFRAGGGRRHAGSVRSFGLPRDVVVGGKRASEPDAISVGVLADDDDGDDDDDDDDVDEDDRNDVGDDISNRSGDRDARAELDALQLRRNPIAVLLSWDLDEPEWHAEEARRRAARAEADAAANERIAAVRAELGAPPPRKRARPDDRHIAGGHDECVPAAAAPDGALRYSVEVNFGNVDLKSAVSARFEVPRAWAPLLTWLDAVPAGGAVGGSEIRARAEAVGARARVTLRLVRYLRRYGLLVRAAAD